MAENQKNTYAHVQVRETIDEDVPNELKLFFSKHFSGKIECKKPNS
jgi:hypothetical protein